MIKLEKIVLVLCILTFSCSVFSQTFKVSQNIISASVFQPITTEGGYTLSFERMIDPGYSRNIAQFSYKMNITLISKAPSLFIINENPNPSKIQEIVPKVVVNIINLKFKKLFK